MATSLWQDLGINTQYLDLQNFHWLEALYKSDTQVVYSSLTRDCLFSFAIQHLWLNRNKNTFHRLCQPLSQNLVIIISFEYLQV